MAVGVISATILLILLVNVRGKLTSTQQDSTIVTSYVCDGIKDNHIFNCICHNVIEIQP